MKSISKIGLAFLIFNFQFLITHAQISINETGNTPDASAMLDVSSTNKGILIPRMDSISRKNISNPATGLMVYDSTTLSFWQYNSTDWEEVGKSSETLIGKDGITILDNFGENSILDVEQAQSSGGASVQAIAWQSFTSGYDGYLTQIDFRFYNGNFGSGTLQIFEGEGISGTKLGELTLGSQSSGWASFDLSALEIAIQANQQYTFYFEEGNGNFFGFYFKTGNPYSGGRRSTNSSQDLVFRTYCKTDASVSRFLLDTISSYDSTYFSLNNIGAINFSDGTTQTTAFSYTLDSSLSISGQLSVTDTVTLSSALIVNGKDLSNIAFTSENGITYSINNNDDFVVGTDSLNYGSGGETAENKFFFDQSKGAIRGGSIIDNVWDETNLGFGSVAFGRGTTASGDYSTAIGNASTANSNYSTAIGRDAVAYSYGEVAIGLYNTSYTPNSTNGYNAADRLFVIGNGTPTTDSDAMIVYKSGNTEINGQLIVSNDFVVGADSLNWESGNESKMFFDKGQFAFRTGRIQNTNWDNANLGLYSFATGTNTLATGNNSVAFGYQSLASGTHSFAGGNSSEANGAISLAFGREVYAPSFGEVAFGLYGTNYTANETSAFDENDRLFSIGNGDADNNRSDAITIYKSGNTEINGQLTVTDTLNLSSALMVNGKDLANTAFTSENGLTSATNSSDDFLFGASMDYGNNPGEVKLFLDQDKAAFRAGTVNSTNWDQGNLGFYSTAIGFGNLASGAGSVALGYGTSASGASTTALGYQSTASGNYSSTFGAFTSSAGTNSASFGYTTVAYGHYSTTFGFNTYAPSYLETVIGSYNTNYSGSNRSSFDSDDRLFVIGNGTGSSARSDAMIVYKSGNTEINGETHVTAEKSGSSEYVMIIENTKNDNTVENPGLLIKAGHDTYDSDNRSSLIRFHSPNGTNLGRIRQNGTSDISFVNSSDIRLKENIQPTQFGIEDILKIEVRDYNFKTDADKYRTTGFLAQQLHTIFPIAVTVGDDPKTNPWGVDYARLTPLLVKGMQDQQAVIDQQNQKLEQQQQKIQQQQSEIEQLKAEVNRINALEAKLETLLKNQ